MTFDEIAQGDSMIRTAAFIVTLTIMACCTAQAQPSAGLYPDPQLTPGAVDPAATVKKLCTPGYTATIRNVPHAEHLDVFRRYGIDPATSAKYEVDHFVSLELGGSNELANLWPQPYVGAAYGARDKDRVENWLHARVCGGAIDLDAAQALIREDWVLVYQRCCGRPTPTWSPGHKGVP